MQPPLTDVELRVLGALVEKEATTPDAYPLTLGALAAACNQSTNREPVMRLDEGAVHAAAAALVGRHLVNARTPIGSRVTKYSHLLRDRLGVGRGELAVLGVLMLRGAQTPGELHARTARLADFADGEQVEGVLEALAAREPWPLVMRLPRRPGQREQRWVQLLGGPPADAGEEAAPAPAAAAPPPPADEGRVALLERRVEELAAEVAALRAGLAELRALLE